MIAGHSPSMGTPDIFNACFNYSGLNLSTPINFAGFQKPRTGNGYAGIVNYIYINDSISLNYREYIELELTQGLVLNKKYCVKFYISVAERPGLAIGNMGFLFKKGPSFYNTDYIINEVPDYVANYIINDTTNWVEISAIFTANDNYDHIIIGNFANNANTQLLAFTNPPQWWMTDQGIWGDPQAYYYIDDVFVVEIENDCPENIDDSVNPVIPNIFTPNKDGYNDEFVMLNLFDNTQLTIYNRWGTAVYQSSNYQNNWDGGNCTDGVYYYVVNTAKGKQYKGTITILRQN